MLHRLTALILMIVTFALPSTATPAEFDEEALKRQYDAFLDSLDCGRIAEDYPKAVRKLDSTDSKEQIAAMKTLAATGEVEITIADDGPGIPPDLQSHMFNPGVSGTEGGLGIGLWLVETFIHQFDGRINYASSETEGTTFVVTLQPLADNS